MSFACVSRVLVVENDLRTRGQLLEILARPGFNIRAAEGQGRILLEDARNIAGSFRPHVVVMDLRLRDEGYGADRSGLELLKEECFSSSRCILHSAYLNYDYTVTRDALVDARVADVVGKEESPRRLISAVEKAAREGCICRHEYAIDWPDAWNEEEIIRCIFKNPRDIPSRQVLDILGRLFSDTVRLELRVIDETTVSPMAVARGRAVLFQVWPDDKEPVVVKLSQKEKIHGEVEAYKEYIKDRLVGRFSAELMEHTNLWDLGGICYSFMGSSQKPLKTFANFYRQTQQADEILKPLEHFFGEVWSRHYSATHTALSDSLFKEYASFLKLREGLDEFPIHEDSLTIPEFSGQYLNPAAWILAHEEESRIATATLAVTHGDLHGDNMFVEDDHCWVIDFERSGRGHILRDFVELEQDIITRLYMLPGNNMYAFYNFVISLTKPLSPMEPIMIPHYFGKDMETRKALAVVEGLRSIAFRMTGFQDMREYYWGLLLDTFFSLKLAKPETPNWTRNLLLSSLLCTRLEQWGDEWPSVKK